MPPELTNSKSFVPAIDWMFTVASVSNVPKVIAEASFSSVPRYKPIDQFPRSYLELFVADAGQKLEGVELIDFIIQVPDGLGGFIDQIDPAAQVRPTMTANGARSSYFIEKMTGTELDDNNRSITSLVEHKDMLDDAELKLISEWLDLGAQNFNNPFDIDAPQN